MPELDFLRGFALLGVMLMNVPHFAGWHFTGQSSTLALLLDAVAQGKFISLFSMLFGYGVAMQLDRPGAPLAPYVRRHVALFVIGIAHGALLFSGDILASYAIGAFAVLLLHRCSVRGLVTWAVVLWSIGAVLTLLTVREQWASGFSKAQMAEALASIESYALGSYADVVATRWAETRRTLATLPAFLPQIVAMFLLGMAAARSRLFAGGEPAEQVLARLRALALPLGLALAFGSAILAHTGEGAAASYGQILMVIFAPILTMGYVGVLVPVFRSGSDGARGHVSNLGRMGLTNYLLHSVVFSLVFYGYAGGQFAVTGYATSALLAVMTYGAMLLVSHWWLERFRFGPAEWVLRSITYGKVQSLERPTPRR